MQHYSVIAPGLREQLAISCKDRATASHSPRRARLAVQQNRRDLHQVGRAYPLEPPTPNPSRVPHPGVARMRLFARACQTPL
jgi:hypothetical protein